MWTPASPPLHRATRMSSPKGVLVTGSYPQCFLTATSIFPCSLIGHYPTKYKLYLVHCMERRTTSRAAKARSHILWANRTLGTHMNNQLRVFHHNTLIVYNSTSHLAQNRMESRSRQTVMKSHARKKQHDHGTSPCRQGLAARRTATYCSLVTSITNETKHMAHLYIRDHRRRPRRPPWKEGQQTLQNETLIVESRQTLRRVESVGMGVTSSMRPMRMPERARARRAL
jgi:hypothetical protein